MNSMWKILHSSWTVLLQLECSALQLSSTKTEEHEHWTIMTNEVFFSLNWKTLRWLN